MAGAGYKLFTTGQVLTAAEVNTYLQEQVIMVFNDATARTTALSGVLAEGMVSYLKSTKVVEIYNGTAWASLDDPNAIQNTIVDAKGDLISASAADVPARLAVGTNRFILNADSAESTGLKWVQAGYTFIKRQTFSAVSSQDVDSVFDTSKYIDYIITFDSFGGSVAAADPQITFLYSGTEQAASYYGYFVGGNYLGTAATITMNNATSGQIGRDMGIYANFRVTDTSGYCGFIGQTMNYNVAESFDGAFYCGQARTYTGFRIKASSGTVSGNVTVYGLGKA